MKIVFFSLFQSFDFNQIGGTDSIIRRVTEELIATGNIVEYVHYAADKQYEKKINDQLTVKYFDNFKKALSAMEQGADYIVSIHLARKDRMKYASFRKANFSTIKFIHLFTVWPENSLKRMLMFAEAKYFPFNGCVLSVSPRSHKHVSKWTGKSTLLLPPVPRDYFIKPEVKPYSNKLRVAFVGRIDPGKGTPEAIELFNKLSSHKRFDTKIFGFPWKHRPETMKLHDKLLSQTDICYEPVEYERWSPQVCMNLCSQLRNIDILILPYKKLSSTIDIPLLLLEGMANLCAVITPNLGDLHTIYGDSPFNLPGDWDLSRAYDIIINAHNWIETERVRIYGQCARLKFDTPTIACKFLKSLKA